MSDLKKLEKARFTYTGAEGEIAIEVDFNPASLDYSISANSQGAGGQSSQVVGDSSAKLNMELIFDTTDTGEDVRKKTNKVEMMLKVVPGEGGHNAPKVAPKVHFEWGAFSFNGIVDSFKQTMDFFSSNGIPLRAAISLSMSDPNYQFDQKASEKEGFQSANVSDELVLSAGDPSSIASAGGDPTAARLIASANNLESLRETAGGQLTVAGGVSIGAAASFSTGASIGFGARISGGAGISAGAQASAGISASAGAFAGLHTKETAEGKYFDTRKIRSDISPPAITADAPFDVTGKVVAQGPAGFRAEVGHSEKIQFDD